jgi:superfamily II DNA or RNA helicase
MSLKNLTIKKEYRSRNDNIVADFYIPLLKESIIYKRAVGFFSSSSLLEISIGLTELIKNKGKIQIIASPELQEGDVEAINKGYLSRKKVISESILEKLKEPQGYFEEERYNLLAHLIEEKRLDIKIALTKNSNGFGIYHEKVGLLYDDENNIVAFSGSMNESKNSYINNYETIDVFTSWTDDLERVKGKENYFDKIWNKSEKNLFTLDFNEKTYNFLKKYRKDNVNIDIDKHQFSNERIFEDSSFEYNEEPKIPNGINLYDYQNEAIKNWKENNYVGIFDMATGTGKTFTAIGGITDIYNNLNKRIFVIAVCPLQHLVEQWAEELRKFNIRPIVAYSNSKQKNWKRRLKNSIKAYNREHINFKCLVTTNATFSSDNLREMVNQLEDDTLLIVDEAHNFGTDRLINSLNQNIKYRLALSATFDRHFDDEGTEKLKKYFGKKCIEYDLERAILENKLTPYYYHPIPVYLKDDELDKYEEITKQIPRQIRKNNNKVDLTKTGKMLLIERSRIIAGAQDKLDKLLEIIEKNRNDKNILVYCGATTITDINYEEGKATYEEKRQIDKVVKMLGNDLNMRVAKFTSEENSMRREEIKKEFAGGDLQTLVAIRCLDEGVDIPSIQKAFILASSTNPKEYIQRRGRVLRKFPGKKFSVIYDFITLPYNLESNKYIPPERIGIFDSLVKRELERVIEFSKIAENSKDSDELINKIDNKYKRLIIEETDYEY